ncbi:MAG TPA: pyridoxamine 5'-phosphate oxidase [Gammaproteobacteria bacterium]|nr:pyridoxamine 5'-phosphate oxidase [Gammaproteobacteria bacterium]
MNTKIRDDGVWPGLSRDELAANPVTQFAYWLDEARLAGIVDANAMTLATAGADGSPSQRMVLLKDFDETGFVFYTNLESRKAREIAGNPQVSLHFGWLPLQRQVIVGGRTEKLSTAEAFRYFSSRPRASRLAAWASRQSRPVISREQLERQFEEVKQRFGEGEIPLPSFWGGYRVRPHSIEFWQGRQHRLHDRFVYRRGAEEAWAIERLSP